MLIYVLQTYTDTSGTYTAGTTVTAPDSYARIAIGKGQAQPAEVLAFPAPTSQQLTGTGTMSENAGTSYLNVVNVSIQGGSASSAADTAAIQAAALQCFNEGGGVVQLPPGQIYLSSSLTVYSSVIYRGSGFSFVYQGIPDFNQLQGSVGTWLIGNGTFPAFIGNSVDGVSAYATSTLFSNAGITYTGLEALGVNNFTYGCKIGSNFNPGSFYSKYERIVAINCGWGWWWENSLHNSYDKVYAFSNTLGQIRFRSSSVTSVLAPANCFVGEMVASAANGANLQRGIVVSCANGTIGGLTYAAILQSNRFGAVSVTQAGSTNGSTSVTVADSTKFAPFMPVAFTAIGTSNLVVNQIYFVKTIVDGTHITIANTPSGTAISPTAGTVTIATQGMACLEVIAEDATAGNNPVIGYIGFLDLEAGGTCKAILHNISQPHFWVAPGMQSTGSTQDIVVRTATQNQIFIWSQNINLDLSDGTAVNTYSFSNGLGANSITGASTPIGFWGSAGTKNANITTNLMAGNTATFQNVANAGGLAADAIKLGVPLLEVTNANNAAATQAMSNYLFVGCLTYTGGASTTYTLPTITASMEGMPYKVCNGGTAAAVLTLAGNSQAYNLNSGRTSITLAIGASISIVARYNGGTPYWQVTGIGGVYSAGAITTM